MNCRADAPRGFSLIEILVVIVIIGVLATLTTVALRSVRSKASDARRLSDVRGVQQAMELYQLDEGGYPAALIWGQPLVGPTSKKTYMNKVPIAPLSSYGNFCSGASGGYDYVPNGLTSYSLNYCLENTFEKCPPGPKIAVPGLIMNGCNQGGSGGSAEVCSCAGKCINEMDSCGKNLCGAPTVPDVQNVHFTQAGVSDGQILITWDPVSGASGYDICVFSGSCANTNFSATDTSNTNSYVKGGLIIGNTYHVAVRARMCSDMVVGNKPTTDISKVLLSVCAVTPECKKSCGDCDAVISNCNALINSNAPDWTKTTTSCYSPGGTAVYHGVKIGSQCWLDKNIDIGTMDPTHAMQTRSASEGITRYCYDDLPANCNTDGGLYTWAMAMYANYDCNTKYFIGYSGYDATAKRQGICPSGFHIPSDYEWYVLEKYIDSTVQNDDYGYADANTYNINFNYTSWRGTDVGLKLKTLLGIPLASNLHGSIWYDRGVDGTVWSSTQYIASSGVTRYVKSGSNTDLRNFGYNKSDGYSVRCIKD